MDRKSTEVSAADEIRQDNHDPAPSTPQEEDMSEASEKPKEGTALPQYSVFSKMKKRCVILAASFGAVFSTLTVQAYLPALQILADDFHVSVAKINLTVTTYLIMQGIAPMVIGSFADRMGRRPAYLISFIVYLAANIGLAVAPNYASLLGIRCLQATGIAATQSLSQAVLADITTSSERGQYIGFVTLSAILGPSLGPIIGGALTDALGWRSIFWFLAICAGVLLLLFGLFFPETCRRIVGDGSIIPPKTNETGWQLLRMQYRKASRNQPAPEQSTTEGKASFSIKHIFTSVVLLWDKELSLLLGYGGLIYCGINAISTALPSQFSKLYGFSSLEIGLVFLPMAVGSVIAVAVAGKALNWNYRRHAKKLGLIVEKGKQIDMRDFPIEQARIEVALAPLYITAIIIIGWGWALDSHTSVAVPFVLSFFMGVFYIMVLNVFNALISDLYRKHAGAAVAANWFVRCMFAAAMSAVIQPLISAVGTGWAYTIIGVAYMICSPALIIVMKRGLIWRQRKQVKEDARLAKNEEARIGGIVQAGDEKA